MTAHRLLMLKPNQLKRHPENVRRFYPEDEVREMADSIRAHDGVLQALLVVPSEKPGVWWVVAGNKRLAGGQLLGKDCPLLKCEPIEADKAQQLLDMATENFVRSNPDAVSEALLYQKLLAKGLKIRDISKQTGIYEVRIRGRLRILELDEPIQAHMALKRLPHGEPTIDALLSIPDKKLRIQLADRLAENSNTTTRTVQQACARLLASLAKKNAPKMLVPAAQLAGLDRRAGGTTFRQIRATAQKACAACDIRENSLRDAKEPAWSAVSHAAGETCGSCTMLNVQMVCASCPLTEFLRRMMPNGKGKE
jgi:ParB/RepB/Spo0J family partition protein